MNIDLKLGDCLKTMHVMDDNSVDSVVSDPPYGINFMGKKWDYDVPKVEVWKEAMRVLKPGGHILIACGTRTQHRMAVNIEDAGFEIRDTVAWVYGSGFPKSHNLGKAVDKLQGNKRKVVGKNLNVPKKHNTDSGRYGWNTSEKNYNDDTITKGTSEWEGWGTGLKPAMELWTLARKPLSEKTIAENVLKWGTGGLNIDGCRVGTSEQDKYDLEQRQISKGSGKETNINFTGRDKDLKHEVQKQGRFPANLIHDGSDEVVGLFPDDNSRFFYCAKASKSERNAGLDTNNHPTVKPVKLMQYLVRLITPKDGTVLDPYMGSGTTGIACKKENFNFVGIELDEDYFKIAEARIKAHRPDVLQHEFF